MVSIGGRNYFSLRETAEILEAKVATVRAWCQRGKINASRMSLGRGVQKDWAVSEEEIKRIVMYGLLEPAEPEPVAVAVQPEPEPGDRKYFTVKEAALRLGKDPYTVREWCREGRIKATKRESACGPYQEWSVSKDEIMRYLDHGLLPKKQPERPQAPPVASRAVTRQSKAYGVKDWASTILVAPSVRG